MKQFPNTNRATSIATKGISLVTLTGLLLLSGCGHSGPTVSDMQSLLTREIAAQGGFLSGIGLDYAAVRVTSLTCTAEPNNVFGCIVTMTGPAGQTTTSLQLTKVNGLWQEVD